MTYKKNRKIKVYILIIIIIFILSNNFQIIFNTRNIFKKPLKNNKMIFFEEKKNKNEDKTKIGLFGNCLKVKLG